MSLPGLGLAEPVEEVHSFAATQHDIVEGSEWRFEVAAGSYAKVQLLRGTAEVFGTEIVSGQTYTFSGTKAAIYTWHGCTVEVSGDACQSEYTAEETPMVDYANVHFALEALRNEGKQQGREGPRVLILGPDNAGKTSLTKILTGYAIRIARQPIVVNLDIKEGMLSIPGTMTAAAFKTLMDVEEGWGSSPMSGPSAIPVKLPLVYYYGLPDPNEKGGEAYRTILSRLALAVSGRLQSDPEAKEAGIIIDTPGSISQAKSTMPGSAPYATVSHIVSEFSVSAILVLGSERLYSDMQKRFDGKSVSSSSSSAVMTPETISVVKLAKSGGCVDRDDGFMQSCRASQARSYFFGDPKLNNGINLSPHQQVVDFAALSIYRLLAAASSAGSTVTADFFAPGEDTEDFTSPDSSVLPGIKSSSSSKSLFERVTKPSAAMTNSVLAVMNTSPDTASSEDLRDASVMGFLYVAEVDEARGKVTLLSPVAGRIPDRAIIWGGWPEEVVGMV